jgi:beta-glucosidase
MTDEAREFPFRDRSLPLEERVADLIGRMTLEEKIAQLGSHQPAIERLGVPAYLWGGECLHGLCHTGRATQFPQAIGLAATFDTDLMRRVADAIATEARVKYHDPAWQSRSVGITFWTPNINIFRDPRWGRGQETYGEDPHLTGALGAAFVRGLQGDGARYMKAMACAKHLAVHSGPEHLRREFNAIASPKDLHETYLPAFKALVDAGVASVMATYNRVNGEACCGSRMLLVDVLRGRWGYRGFVVSDAGAMHAMHTYHHVTEDALETAALCMECGCDMEIGSRCYQELPRALEQGLATEEQIDRSLARIMTVRFRLGMMDDPADVPFASIGSEAIQCDAHVALAREAATKSIVMLKNNGVLPFGPDRKTILVCGPTAVDLDVLLGNFYRGSSARLVSVLEGVVGAAPDGTAVTCMTGCMLKHPNDFDSGWVMGLAEWADAVVAAVGISPLMEGEQGECIATPTSGDREKLELPENQLHFLRKLKDVGKPLVVVVTGGSPVAMPEVHEMADAVLFIWYPGEQGGTGVGDVVFGHESPSGRLPVTFPMSEDQLPPFEDYSMVGRTYRYVTEEPLYPFGFGLSYARFEYGPTRVSPERVERGGSVAVEVEVRNAGECEADEVVQLYLTDDEASVRVPRWELKAFRRVRLAPGASETVAFEISPEQMELVDESGGRVLEPGTFTVTVGGSSPGARSEALGAPPPAVGRFELA